MENKYYEKLEFNKIKDILEKYCITFAGKKLVNTLQPMNFKGKIEKACLQTFDASNLLYRKGNIPVSEIADITKYLKSLEAQIPQNAKVILDLTNVLKISQTLKNYFFNDEIDMDEFTSLKPLFENLYSNPSIQEKV